jgi:DNA-directed RNA polymerase specialized sigma24 family protein
VELARRYSNQLPLLADLSSAWQALRRELINPTTDDTLAPRSVVHPPRPPAQRESPRRARRRLTDAEVQALLKAYQAGTSSLNLAKSYGISKQKVLSLLAQHGVERRCQPMTESQVAEAKRLYESGLSVSAISQRLGVPWTTVQRALRRTGAEMRPRGRLPHV